MMKEWDFEAEKNLNKFKKIKYTTLLLCLMEIIGLLHCDPCCLLTQNWLKIATNDISIQEFHNVMAHYKPH